MRDQPVSYGSPGDRSRPESRGSTVWLTGLSGAGKTTIAEAVADHCRALYRSVEVLDGDE
ncbi:MAG TPA: adenylyl-sulfate kinase, partial [Pseudonocardiaceae bacterium]|nr:adenylyl-sulfate kinase [Pseudonocardiaceae bacterium]